MIRRLRDRRSVDRIPIDLRRRRGRGGQWVYLALLFGFFLWLADLVIGPLLRLEAGGLVIAEHVSIGVPFTAQVKEVAVVPGAAVKAGDKLAQVNSLDLSLSIATLTARNAELLAKRAEIQQRARVAAAVLPIARDREHQADLALERIRSARDGGNVSLATWSMALSERFTASERVAVLQAEAFTADSSINAVDAALTDTTQALDQMSRTYGDGVLVAPEDGIVGFGTARPGDVLTVGQPLMVLYGHEHYVLAYLETGTLYSLSVGDEVQITDGFHRSTGRIADILPVAEQLPEEFRKIFQPRGRSQVARITLLHGVDFPLFSKVSISGIGWLSPGTFIRVWLDNLLQDKTNAPRPTTPATGPSAS
ncbi:MAG: biotin/lipoyl-binding protein [Rhodospirillales bacterium]|nr:biotin/lipoyl-binding protein [Rhodospirillales bacterium]